MARFSHCMPSSSPKQCSNRILDNARWDLQKVWPASCSAPIAKPVCLAEENAGCNIIHKSLGEEGTLSSSNKARIESRACSIFWRCWARSASKVPNITFAFVSRLVISWRADVTDDNALLEDLEAPLSQAHLEPQDHPALCFPYVWDLCSIKEAFGGHPRDSVEQQTGVNCIPYKGPAELQPTEKPSPGNRSVLYCIGPWRYYM